MVQELLDILTKSEFDLKNLSQSVVELKKEDNQLIANLVTSRKFLTCKLIISRKPLEKVLLSTGKWFYFHNVLTVLQSILANKILTRGMFFFFTMIVGKEIVVPSDHHVINLKP
jgi:hypothetical protein